MTGARSNPPAVHGGLVLAGVLTFAIVVGLVGLFVCAASMICARSASAVGALRASRGRLP